MYSERLDSIYKLHMEKSFAIEYRGNPNDCYITFVGMRACDSGIKTHIAENYDTGSDWIRGRSTEIIVRGQVELKIGISESE